MSTRPLAADPRRRVGVRWPLYRLSIRPLRGTRARRAGASADGVIRTALPDRGRNLRCRKWQASKKTVLGPWQDPFREWWWA